MRNAVAIVGMISTTAAAQQSMPATSAAPPLVFDRVTVVDVEQGKLVSDQRVVIVGNRIQAMGNPRTVQTPKNARVVNVTGRYLIPGLWDMHAHIDGYMNVYSSYIAHGVTGIRELGQRNITNNYGLDSFAMFRRAVAEGKRVGPRTAGPSVDLDYVPELVFPRDAIHIIDSLKAANLSFVKFHNGGGNPGNDTDPDIYFALLREARRVGLPVVGHTPWWVTDTEVADSGQHSVEHLDQLHCWRWLNHGDTIPWSVDPDTAAIERRCAQTVAAFNRNDTWLVPTMVVDHWLPTSVRRLDALTVVRLLYRLGFRRFLTGTDVLFYLTEMQPRFWYGTAVLEEVMLLAEAGLTPGDALRAATLNPAKFFAATDSLGTVAPGKLADLVLLDANPLADIRNLWQIRAVVANGRYFDRAALDALDNPERAKRSVDALTRYGRLLAPVILGTDIEVSNGQVHITGIKVNSPAEAAGLKVGEVILAVDGEPVHSGDQVVKLVRSCRPGQTIALELGDGDARRTVRVQLYEKN